MTALVDINEIHRRFWEKRLANINALCIEPYLLKIVAKREAEKARSVHLAMNEATRIERIRNQKPFESELEIVADEFASLPIVEAQRQRAKKPRGKVTHEGITLDQVIEMLVCKPEYRNFSAPELWPHLFSELEDLELDPTDINSTDPKKSAYSYDFKSKRKAITYGRFANLISKYRKKSR
jgi:hypothetical protein